MHIWFNLLLLVNHQVYYIDAQDTLEDCQQERAWYEEKDPHGKYVCVAVQVDVTSFPELQAHLSS